MSVNQSDVQASIRVSTGTAYDYNGDWMALFDQAGIALGPFDGRMLAWINAQLSTSYGSLPVAQQAYAVFNGFANWSSMTSLGAHIDFFVDTVSGNGSDANPGTSDAAPFATVAPLLAKAANSLNGKTIAFRRGGSYTPMDLGLITADSCTVTAYGSGALPFFDCTAAVPGTWSLQSAGVYKVTLTRANSGDVKLYGNYFQWTTWTLSDGSSITDWYPMRKVESLAALSGKPAYTVYADTETSGTVTLYMNASTDPNLDTPGYRWSKYGCAINLAGSRNKIDSLWARGSAAQDGMFKLGAGTGGNILARCRADWGGRHSAYVGSGPLSSLAELNAFNGGANEVETGPILNTAGGSNGLVFNSPDHTLATCTSRSNTFNGMGRPNYVLGTKRNFTGPYGHDSVQGRAMTQFVSESDVFIGLLQGPGGCGVTTTISNASFTDGGDAISVLSDNISVSMTGTKARSVCNRLVYNNTNVGVSLNYKNNGLMIIPDCGDGGAGFIRLGEGTVTQFFLDMEANSFWIQGIRTVNANKKFLALLTGSLRFVNNNIGPNLAPPVDLVLDCGSGVTVNAVNDSNLYPLGSNFKLGATTYRGLAAWRAQVGGEAASTYQTLPTPEMTDDFTGADTNLENVPPWARLTGVAGALQRKSNLLTATSTTQSVYTRGDLATLEQYVSYTLMGVPAAGGGGPLLRLVDGTNWLESRVTSTAHQLALDTAGTVTVPIQSTTIAPAIGQNIIAVVRNYTDPNTGTVDLRASVIVDGAMLLNLQQLTAPALTAELTVGAMARSTVADVLDDLKFGPAPLAA